MLFYIHNKNQAQEETNKMKDKKIVAIAGKRRDPNRHCKHYDVAGNIDEKCWKLHLKLNPKWLKSKRKTKKATKTKEVVEITSDLDEAIVCTKLQQTKVSGYKRALFQIKVQENNQKVNTLFDNGS